MRGRPRRRAPLALPLLLAVAGAGCGDAGGAADGAAQAPPPGRLVIIGGALSRENQEVYQAILDGREGDGPLCVIPTASADAQSSMESAVETLARYAGEASVRGVLLTTEDPGRAGDPGVAAELAACSGFFFTGGVQSRILDVFLPAGDTTEAFRAVWSRWHDGAVVSGSSAGAAMMSGVMIASGTSLGALTHGVASGGEGEGLDLRPGMGFFTRAVFDQHFLARGRIGRLVTAALVPESVPVGLGIDENTALVVEGDEGWVVGASGVVVVDARTATRVGAVHGNGVRVSLAGAGDRVDLSTFRVTHADGKVPLTVSDGVADAAAPRPGDPFARWAFLHLLVGLAAGPDTAASFEVAGSVLTVRESGDFSAAALSPSGGVQETPAGFSAGPFILDLAPAAAPAR